MGHAHTHTPHLLLQFVEFLLQSLLLLAQSGGYHQHGSWFRGRAQDIFLHCHRPGRTRRALCPTPALQACLLPWVASPYPCLSQAAAPAPARRGQAALLLSTNHGHQGLGHHVDRGETPPPSPRRWHQNPFSPVRLDGNRGVRAAEEAVEPRSALRQRKRREERRGSEERGEGREAEALT